MLGTKYPLEYEITLDDMTTRPEGSQWYIVRLRNISKTLLLDLEVQLVFMDGQEVVENEKQTFGSLGPDEPRTMRFLVHAPVTNEVYLNVFGRERKSYFYWNSPLKAVEGVVHAEQQAKTPSRLDKMNEKLLSELELAKVNLHQRQNEAIAKIETLEKKALKDRERVKSKIAAREAEIEKKEEEGNETFDRWLDGKGDADSA